MPRVFAFNVILTGCCIIASQTLSWVSIQYKIVGYTLRPPLSHSLSVLLKIGDFSQEEGMNISAALLHLGEITTNPAISQLKLGSRVGDWPR
ncbi:hypothetical protein LINGRAHAP2_LOCUS22769 [Linum grandiflorum]